jgi:hypothetical protein
MTLVAIAFGVASLVFVGGLHRRLCPARRGADSLKTDISRLRGRPPGSRSRRVLPGDAGRLAIEACLRWRVMARWLHRLAE